ncbi:MAG: DUF456 domain-containing protein [Verrucomicrobiia bacterium]
MSVDQWVGLILALVVMGVGIVGSIVPGLPGAPLVLIAAIVHRIYFGEASASNLVLGLLVALTLTSLVLDYLASVLGARKMGATWRGVAGALVGAVVGLFFGLLGIILGPLLGALLFEMLGGRDFPEATRAGTGALLGLFVGIVGKLACCVAMTALFTVNVLSRTGTPVLA